MYLVFVVAGLSASRYTWSEDLVLLAGVLAAYGTLDAVVLQQIRAIEGRTPSTASELEATRVQVDRLIRLLLRAGIALAATFALLLAVLVLT